MSLSECTQLREVSIPHPYPKSTVSLLKTIRSPQLKKFMVYFADWTYGGEDAGAWRDTDQELCAAYNLWIKHGAGAIEVAFCMWGVVRAGHLLEGYQKDLKRFFPRLTENVRVTIVC